MCVNYDNCFKFNDELNYMSGLVSPFDEHEKYPFGLGLNIRMNSKHYEESGYGLDLDLVNLVKLLNDHYRCIRLGVE